jgi:protein TonB
MPVDGVAWGLLSAIAFLEPRTFFEFRPTLQRCGADAVDCGAAWGEFHADRGFPVPQDPAFGGPARERRTVETARGSAAFHRAVDAEAFNPTVVTKKTKLSALSAEFNTMKAVNQLAVLFSLVALSSVSASAKTDEQTYLDSCRKDPGVPVPVAVVAPSVSPDYAGSTVQLEFIVDVTGKPANFSVKSNTDVTLAAAVTEAVKQWRFSPAMSHGVAVATKVSLPIRIVDDSLAGTR